jgi:hypothetical protein
MQVPHPVQRSPFTTSLMVSYSLIRSPKIGSSLFCMGKLIY